MKTCAVCHETKPLSQFYPHRLMPDGYLKKCKYCERARQNAAVKADPIRVARARERASAWRAAYPDRAREANRAWRRANAERLSQQQRAWRKANPARVRANKRAWTATNRAQVLAWYRAWRKGHPASPEKSAARHAVNYAISAGRLVRQPCEICGVRAHAHHDDYSKPLAVRWLCPLHHAAIHHAKATA